MGGWVGRYVGMRMCVGIYVFCIQVYMCIHRCIHTYRSTHRHICTHMYVRVCMQTCLLTHRFIFYPSIACVSVFAFEHWFMLSAIYFAYIHVYLCACMLSRLALARKQRDPWNRGQCLSLDRSPSARAPSAS